MKPRSTYGYVASLAVACAVVGVLAALGKFSSINNFPLVFAGVCVILGGLSLWRERPRRAVVGRAALTLAGAVLAVVGWLYHQNVVRLSQDRAQERALTELRGEQAPAISGLDPLNTDQAAVDAAASFAAKATIVNFWATWCSPCAKELPELEALYREHSSRGLSVLAVTRYAGSAPEDRVKARRSAERFLEKRELTLPAAITSDPAVYEAYRVASIPRTVLIDRNGRIAAYAVGLDNARDLMRQAAELVARP